MEGGYFTDGLSAEFEEFGYDFFAAQGLIDDLLDVLDVLGLSRESLFKELRIDHDARKGVVDLVGDARRHPPDGCDLLRLDQLKMGLFKVFAHLEDFPHIREHTDAPYLHAFNDDN